jgi:hypothetical protein
MFLVSNFSLNYAHFYASVNRVYKLQTRFKSILETERRKSALNDAKFNVISFTMF